MRFEGEGLMAQQTRVLIVDDQVGMLETLIDILADRGLEVDTADNGYVAIRKMKEQSYDLAFMDIKMPGINGVQTFRELKKIDPKITVIMMTAYAVEDLIEEAIREGAYTVVYKPFDIEKIVQTIERALKTMLVLVVDDRLDDREVFKEILEQRGYKVATAKTGDEALAMVKASDFDIIFLDVKLPDIDGLKVFEEIHRIKPTIPVIMITGYSVQELLEEAVQKGAYACLMKPLEMNMLLKIVHEVREKQRDRA
jgi:DNA-binding NtrC family response regulator